MPTADHPLIAETAAMLAAWSRMPPARERSRLMLLALEREQIAAIAYDDAFIVERVARLRADPVVRDLVRHALIWAWKDEELHTLYVRGRLLAAKGHRLRIHARQAQGLASGWVAATRHHRTPARAAARWAIASAATLAARLTGQVPAALRDELEYQDFGRYCRLNIALERSAELCYERLVELARDATERAQFDRIRADEARHREVFAVLAGAFAEDETPVVTAGELAGRLAAVSPWFLPAAHRPGRARGSIATGGDVHVAEGGDLAARLTRILDESGLGERVRAGGGKVAVRTAFTLGYSARDRSNTVSPEIVALLAAYLRANGASDVAVLEAPSIYERYYANRSVAEVAERLGFTDPGYRVVDVSGDQVETRFDRGVSQSTVSRAWRDADVRVVLSKLRTDPRQGGHLSLNTLVGTGERTDRTTYTNRELDHENAIMMILDAHPPDFAVVDAWGPVATGAFGVMACDKPVRLERLYAGPDPVAVDWRVLTDMGVPDPGAMPIIRRALAWFGRDGRPGAVHGDTGPITADLRLPHGTWTRRLFAKASYPIYLHLSRHGERFTPEMDEEAFPPLRRASASTRAIRWVTRRVFGLRPPR